MDFSQVKAITIPEGDVIRILSGATVLWEKTGLPTEYQQVEYVESDRNSYVETNITPQDNDALYAKVQCVTGSADAYRPFGAYRPGVSVDGYRGIRIWTYDTRVIQSVNLDDQNIHEISVDSAGTWSYDGTTIATEFPILTANTGMTIILFKSRYLNNAITGTASSRIYRFTYTRSNAIIGDFIPCYRKADGVIGMYDLASATFLTNSGTGTFSKGPDV